MNKAQVCIAINENQKEKEAAKATEQEDQVVSVEVTKSDKAVEPEGLVKLLASMANLRSIPNEEELRYLDQMTAAAHLVAQDNAGHIMLVVWYYLDSNSKDDYVLVPYKILAKGKERAKNEGKDKEVLDVAPFILVGRGMKHVL